MTHLKTIMEKIKTTPHETNAGDLIEISNTIESCIEFYSDSTSPDDFETNYRIDCFTPEIIFNIHFFNFVKDDTLIDKIDNVFDGWIKTVGATDGDLEYRINTGKPYYDLIGSTILNEVDINKGLKYTELKQKVLTDMTNNYPDMDHEEINEEIRTWILRLICLGLLNTVNGYIFQNDKIKAGAYLPDLIKHETEIYQKVWGELF